MQRPNTSPDFVSSVCHVSAITSILTQIRNVAGIPHASQSLTSNSRWFLLIPVDLLSGSLWDICISLSPLPPSRSEPDLASFSKILLLLPPGLLLRLPLPTPVSSRVIHLPYTSWTVPLSPDVVLLCYLTPFSVGDLHSLTSSQDPALMEPPFCCPDSLSAALSAHPALTKHIHSSIYHKAQPLFPQSPVISFFSQANSSSFYTFSLDLTISEEFFLILEDWVSPRQRGYTVDCDPLTGSSLSV